MGVIPNPKMAFIFPISCILALIFPILIKYFPKCVGKGSFPKSQIKSLALICGTKGIAIIPEFANLEVCVNFVSVSGTMIINQGVHWLSGGVLDSRPKGRGFEPLWRHALWSLNKTHLS